MIRRTKLVTAAVTIAIVAGGSTIMANVGNTPEPVKSTVSEVLPVANEPAISDTAAPDPVQPVQPQTQPQVVPQPADPCIADKASALAPYQAKIDETNAIAKTYKDGWNTGRGTSLTEEQLNEMVEVRFGSVFRANQAAYDATASQLDC